MNVLLLTTSFPLEDASSSGIFVYRLSRQLARQHQVTVLTPADAWHCEVIKTGDITVVPFRYAPVKWQILAHAPGGIPVALKRNPLMYLLLPLLLGGMLYACLRNGRTMDVIHANWAICGVVAGLAGKALGISVVTTLRGEDMTRAACKLLDKLLLKLCICLSDGMVGVSQTIVDFLRQRTVPGKTHVCLIENGVDDALLSIQREYNDIKILRLITIGSLIPRKGMDVILKALNAYTGQIPLTLTIVGEGVEEIALRRLAQENDLAERVHFIGAVKPDHIPRLLQQHDVLILASYSEGRPNVILEAMAAEMPVIGSDIPGVDELVRDGETGFLFKAGDTSELAASIDSLLQTQASLRRMGRNARQDILQRGLVWQTTADKYSTLYRTVMRANR